PFGQKRFANSDAVAKSPASLARRSTITASTAFFDKSCRVLSTSFKFALFKAPSRRYPIWPSKTPLYNEAAGSGGALSRVRKSNNPPGIRTSSPVSVARFNSVSVIASGFGKLFFKSEIVACRSPSFSELMISCVPGVGDGVGDTDGVTDLLAGVFAVGAPDGAGDWASRLVMNKNEITVAAPRFNIGTIVSWSPRPEQYRAGNGNRRNECGRPLHKRAGALR